MGLGRPPLFWRRPKTRVKKRSAGRFDSLRRQAEVFGAIAMRRLLPGFSCGRGHRIGDRRQTGTRVNALEHFGGSGHELSVLHVDQSLGGQRGPTVRTSLQQSDRIVEARSSDGDGVELVGEAPV